MKETDLTTQSENRLLAAPTVRPYVSVQPEALEFPLVELWQILLKRKFTVLVCFMLLTALAALYTFTRTPLYEGVARLRIDLRQSPDLGMDDLRSQMAYGDSDTLLQTEVKVLESHSIAGDVIDKLGLVGKPGFMVKGTKPGARIEDLSSTGRVSLLKSFQLMLKVRVIPNTDLIEVRFRHPDAKLAAGVANAIVASYVERNFRTHYESTVQVSDWLSKQLEDIKAKSYQAQQQLADFQRKNNIIGPDENDNITVERLRQLNQQLTDAEADRILKEARYRMAASGDPELIAEVVPSTSLQVLRTEQAQLRAQYAELTTKFGPGYPKVRDLQGQLAKLDKTIDAEVQNVGRRIQDDYLASVKTEDMLRARFEDQKQKAYVLNASATQYAILRHEVDSSRQLYDNLQTKLKEAFVNAGLSSSNISMLDRAEVPPTPVSPNKPMNMGLGMLLGLAAGVVAAFLRETLDDTISSSEHVEATVSLPSLATIPLVHSRSLVPRRFRAMPPAGNGSGSMDLIAARHLRSSVSESYRALISSILLCSVDSPPKVIVVTSAFPQEGKSATSINSAIVLAQRGARVLLVDCDLRRSTVHEKFGIRNDFGLTTLLGGTSGPDVITAPLQELPNLHVLPAGPHPPSPVDILASGKMKGVLTDWAGKYDHIVIDTPPLVPVSDALILAARANVVLLVARAGFTKKQALRHTRDLLLRANAHVAGVVLNAVDMKRERYYLGSYRYSDNEAYYGEKADHN